MRAYLEVCSRAITALMYTIENTYYRDYAEVAREFHVV